MQSEYAIEMIDITKIFPGIVANDHITLRLKRERSMPCWEKTAQGNLR